jgi:hypothetical protein
MFGGPVFLRLANALTDILLGNLGLESKGSSLLNMRGLVYELGIGSILLPHNEILGLGDIDSERLVLLLVYFIFNGNWGAHIEVVDVVLCQVEQCLDPDVKRPRDLGDGAHAGFLLDQRRLCVMTDLLALLLV